MVVRELITKLGFNTDTTNLNKYEQGIERVKGGVNSLGNSLSGIGTIVKIVGGAIATAGIFSLGKSILDTVGEVEQYRVTLGTMIGDQEKANKIIHDLDYSPVGDFYGTVNAIGGLQGLVTFGVQAEDASDTLTRLGDIAQGNSEAFKSLSLNMGQVFAKGKADAMDIKQFVTQGFDVVGEISKITGKSREEIEKAGVTYDLVARALKNITDEGGKYNGMLEKQSNTYPGLIKRFTSLKMAIKEAIGFNLFDSAKSILGHLYDTLKNMQDKIVEIGTNFFNAIGNIVSYIIATIELLAIRTNNFAGVRKALSDIVAVGRVIFGIVVKIGTFLIPIFDKILAIIVPILTVIFIVKQVIALIKIINTLMTIFNVISAMNPLALIIIVIIGLIAILIFNWDKVKEWFKNFFTWLRNGFIQLFNKIKSIWQGIKDFFMNLWNGIYSVFQNVVDFIIELWAKVAMFFQTLWQAVKNVFFGFIDWVGGIWDSVIEGIKNVWGGLVGFFSDLWKKVFGGFTDFIDGIKKGINTVKGWFGFGDSDVNVKAQEGLVGVSNNYASNIYSNNNPNTVNSTANITVNVPAGTSAEQAKIISEQVHKEINNSLNNVINGSRANIPTPEARGF